MKKLILLLSITLLFSCSKGDDVYIIYEVPIEEPISNPNNNCYYVISIGGGPYTECGVGVFVIKVVDYVNWKKGGPYAQWQQEVVCITNEDYANHNSFQLGQKICELSIYK